MTARSYTPNFPSYFHMFFTGLILGLRSLIKGGIKSAGLKRSLGFVLQPIEMWSRYPELSLAAEHLGNINGQSILDLGSPKMFGFILASQYKANMTLTDIWPLAVNEFKDLHDNNLNHLQSQIVLKEANLTQLSQFADNSFDQVYSISVIEHIESLDLIKKGMTEIYRVLKPGGHAVVSIFVGGKHEVISIDDSVYGREKKGSDEKVFFSHRFGPSQVQELFLESNQFILEKIYYLKWLEQNFCLNLWMKLPQKLRGLLGIINLFLAPISVSIHELSRTRLNEINSTGDLLFVFKKPQL